MQDVSDESSVEDSPNMLAALLLSAQAQDAFAHHGALQPASMTSGARAPATSMLTPQEQRMQLKASRRAQFPRPPRIKIGRGPASLSKSRLSSSIMPIEPITPPEPPPPPKPTWGMEEWKWGAPDGKAGEAIRELMPKLANPGACEQYLAHLATGKGQDFDEAKLALALAIQSMDPAYELPEGKSWKELMNELISGKFEGPIGDHRLRASLNKRIPEARLKDTVFQKLVYAFEDLEFATTMGR